MQIVGKCAFLLDVIKMSSKCHQNVIRIITNSGVGLSGAELSCGSVWVWEINYSGWELRLTQLPTKLKLKLKLKLSLAKIVILRNWIKFYKILLNFMKLYNFYEILGKA